MVEENMEVAWSGRSFRVLLVPKLYSDGTVHTHEQIEAPDIVRVYPLTGDGAIYLIKEYRHDVNDTILRVPAGRVKEAENPEDAARRELREEAGFDAGSIDLLRRSQPVLKFRYHVWHFVAKGISHMGQSLEQGEDIDLIEFPLKDIPNLIFDGKIKEDSLALSLLIISRNESSGGWHG